MTSGTAATGILAPPYRRATVGAVATVLLLAFEAMGVATAMPVAVADLDGLPLYGWAFSGFLVTSLAAMVLSGEVCDRRGPLWPVVAGLVTFTAGLLLAGTAPVMQLFVVGRAVQGIGVGLMIVALYVAIGRTFPDELRPRVFAALSSAWVLPSIVGPVVSGAVSEHASWRLVFLGLVPFLVLPLLLVVPELRRLGPPERADGAAVSRARGIDRVVRAAVAAAGLVLLQLAGQRLDAWSVPLAMAAAAALAVGVPRLLPRGTLRLRRGLPAVVAMRGVLAGAFFGAEAFVPLMLVEHRALGVTAAGATLTAGALGWASGSWFQGRPGLQLPRHLLVPLGSALVAGGIAGAALAVWQSVPVWVVAPMWAVGGFGMGMAMSTISVLVFRLSEPGEEGANSAAVQVSDSLGSTLLVGLAGVVLAAGQAGAEVPPETFLAIFAVMVAIAGGGAAVGSRVRPRAGRSDTPGRPGRPGVASRAAG